MKIKEQKCGFMGVASEVEAVILPFATDANQCEVKYSVKNTEGNVILSGNYLLHGEEFANWGSDNAHVEDCVLKHLGLERD